MFNLDRNTVFSSLMGILIISLIINRFTEFYNASVVYVYSFSIVFYD